MNDAFEKLINFYKRDKDERGFWGIHPVTKRRVVFYDNYKLWENVFTSQSTLGHDNNQHTYPDFMLKLSFTKENYQLNRIVIPDNTKKGFSLKPCEKGAKPYKELYSSVANWSSDMEGWMNNIESTFDQILKYKGIATKDELLFYLTNPEERLVKIGFLFMVQMSFLRSQSSQKYLRYVNGSAPVGLEERFLEPENWNALKSTVMQLTETSVFHYHSDLGLALNKDIIKLIPKNINDPISWNNRHLTNSLLMVPISSEDLLVFIFPKNLYPEIEFHSGILSFFHNDNKLISKLKSHINEIAFDTYNSCSININSSEDRIFTTKDSKLRI